MKTRLMALFCMVCMISIGCNRVFGGFSSWGGWGGGVKGSGVSKTEQRSVDTYTAIEVGGAFELEVVAGQNPSLEITADDNLLDLIKTEMRGSTLVISTRQSINPKTKLLIKTTTRTLESIDASGACEIRVSQVNNDNLRIETSGAGEVDASVNTKSLSIETTGAGNVKVSGSTQSFSIETSGAGEVRAQNLQAQVVKVDVSGAGDVEVHASAELDVRVSGAGEVTYTGNPKIVNQSVRGAGSVRRKN